jgi:hypothetical protein
VTGTQISVSCDPLSSSKFSAFGEARNTLREDASGGARVTLYAHGGDARLYDVRCEKLLGTAEAAR